MTQKIELYVEGVVEPVALSLGVGHGAVVGRAPEAAQRSLTEALGGPLEAVAVPSHAVSSAHVLVRDVGDGAVTVRDLGSINETWLMLARGQSVTVQAEGAPLRVAVGMGGPSWRVREDPPEPQWRRRQDYPEAMREAVERWARDQGLPVAPTLSPRANEMDPRSRLADDPTWFALRDGWGLSLGTTRQTLATDERVTQRLAAWVRAQNELFDGREDTDRHGIVVESPAFQEALRATLIAARRSFRVLFTGPSGSGKSTLAERYHRHCNKSEPMVTVNCSQFGVDDNLNHALLFGCAPGAVSNAMRRGSPGYVGEADGSTLFLDEVALLPPAVQANLLLFLDGPGSYRPLGGLPRVAAVRVVSATNADLRALVREGRFREDLWHRLRGVEIALPSMRERPEDLAAWLLRRDGDAEREVITAMTPDAREALFEQPWTGGFRELGNVLDELSLRKEVRRLQRIDRDTVLAAIAAASPALPARQCSTAAAPRPQPLALQPTGEASVDPRWAAVVTEALQWFFRESPRALRYPQLEEFVRQYLRPTFVAHGCQLAGARERPPKQSPESLGRMIDLGRDMVSAHLERYFMRP